MADVSKQESEYGFVSSELGIAKKKPAQTLTPSEKARLMRCGADPRDPASKKSDRAWLGLKEQ